MSAQHTSGPDSTVKLLEDLAKYGANMMWHLKPHTEAGKLYARIEQELAAARAPLDEVAEKAAFDAVMDAPVCDGSLVSVRAMHRNGGAVALVRRGWMIRAAIAKATGSAA